MRSAPKPVEPGRAFERLAELCARSEQCSYDLRQKLRRWLVAEGAAERIMAKLREGKFVDDERFARLYAAQKYQFDRWGRKKIVIGLIAKRIGRDTIREALDEVIDPDIYEENLRTLLRAKMRMLGAEADSYDGRTRLFRYGASRGYEPDMVIRLIKDPSLWQQEE